MLTKHYGNHVMLCKSNHMLYTLTYTVLFISYISVKLEKNLE